MEASASGAYWGGTARPSTDEVQCLEEAILDRLRRILGYAPEIRREEHDDGVIFYLFFEDLSHDDLLNVHDIDWEIRTLYRHLKPRIEIVFDRRR